MPLLQHLYQYALLDAVFCLCKFLYDPIPPKTEKNIHSLFITIEAPHISVCFYIENTRAKMLTASWKQHHETNAIPILVFECRATHSLMSGACSSAAAGPGWVQSEILAVYMTGDPPFSVAPSNYTEMNWFAIVWGTMRFSICKGVDLPKDFWLYRGRCSCSSPEQMSHSSASQNLSIDGYPTAIALHIMLYNLY